MEIGYAHETHPGMERDENQDACGVFEGALGHLFVVCDGMGGHAGGSVASRLAVDTIGEAFVAEPAHAEPSAALGRAVQAANEAVLARAAAEPSLHDMGTTCVTLLVAPSGEVGHHAHVGDSRLYRLRGDELSRLTQDHTKVQRLVDQGVLTPDQAALHPEASVISRTVGADPDLEVDVGPAPLPLQNRDIFLLCSDGLTAMIDDDQIADYLREYAYDDVCRQFVSMANARGGYDNITVLVVQVGDRRVAAGTTASGVAMLSDLLGNEAERADQALRAESSRHWVALATAGMVVILVLCLLAWLW